MPSVAKKEGNTRDHSSLNHGPIVCNIDIINDQNNTLYDGITVSPLLYQYIYGTEINGDVSTSVSNTSFVPLKDHYCAIKLLGSAVFDQFKLFTVNGVHHQLDDQKTIRIINDSNFSRFEYITLNQALYLPVETGDIPVLTSCYISVPGSIYEILNGSSVDSIRTKFLNTFLAGKNRVVNNGDHIRDINGTVKLCEPLDQGKVNENTNFVLIKEDEVSKNQLVDDLDLDEDFDKVADSVDLSKYLDELIFDDSEQSVITSETTKTFDIKPLNSRIGIESLPWTGEDEELFVFISSQDLFSLNLPIFNGETVKLTNGDEKSLFVKLFVFSEPNEYSKGKIYVSPLLMVNLGSSTKVSISPIPNEDRKKPLSKLIPIADSITISRIVSNISMDRTYLSAVLASLKNQLKVSYKCVRLEDAIAVTIDTIMAKTVFDQEDAEDIHNATEPENKVDIMPEGEPDAVAWFKITNVNGVSEGDNQQYIIDPIKTKLVVSGNEFIRLPPNDPSGWADYLKLPGFFKYPKFDTTETVFKYKIDLERVLKTNLETLHPLKSTVLLNSMSRGIGKSTLVQSVCLELGLNLITLDCVELLNPGKELKTIGTISGKLDKILSQQPTLGIENSKKALHVVYFKHIEKLCVSSNANEQNFSIHESQLLKFVQMLQEYFTKYTNIVFVFSCNDLDKLNNNFKLMMKFQIDIGVPSEAERLSIFKYLIEREIQQATDPLLKLRSDVDFSHLALQSAGLTPRDLQSIMKSVKKFAIKRLSKLGNFSKQVAIGNGGYVIYTPEDFALAINEARNQFSDSIGAPRIPNVKWEDIGGLDMVKGEILDTIDMPLKHPELFSSGLKKRSGILFYGPPGTGKTLLAKAIATNFSLNFFSVKGPELLNMYIGESEANVRRVFQKARDAKPCVIFFDELDSVAPKRGNQGDSGGVMDRIVSQLLAELDGMSGGSNGGGDGVFVVGATNRPDLLDEALLRPGRFDKMLYLGISDTDEKQFKILEALTRKFKLDDDVDLMEIARTCSFTFTGADFYALCSDSMLNAMTRIAGEVDTKFNQYNNGKTEPVSIRWWFDNVSTPDDISVVVKQEDFVKAKDALIPSVSAEELQHYLRVKENFEGAKDKAAQLAQEGENGH
ncbi:peroxisomal assembly protein [Scheffersomyces spartinae]|uniref:Peroxisomal ATPase PEX6 n=1 Tax=Scheffersomyces spartinae TaxID=45513 RepID=A0A9P7VD06_9ASCO|nr:peroxisomal assembly protein [Scheffersomyces spartinae]KAG7195835.1 peroxisomal assembly protein [Scheffersomyces spartinae]